MILVIWQGEKLFAELYNRAKGQGLTKLEDLLVEIEDDYTDG